MPLRAMTTTKGAETSPPPDAGGPMTNPPAAHAPRSGPISPHEPGVGRRRGPHRGPVLSAKLSVPPILPVYLPRQRLLDLLTEGSRGRLTAVTACAGSGKTVLVSSWARMG